MSIPLEVLQKWAKPGKNEMSKQTYSALRDVLLKKLDSPQPNIYLQGSYRNSTNVRDNSDIDIVVEFSSDYDVYALKKYVFNKINNANNFQFLIGAKTVKYKGLRNKYVPADIVPCVSVKGATDCVKLYDSKRNILITNYPKIHIRNGEAKSSRTDGNFKKAVRMMKNARNYLDDNGVNVPVSSFVIECMLYNMPDEVFSGNELAVCYNVLNWFNNNRSWMSAMRTQDEMNNLFSASSNASEDAKQFMDKVIILWNNWGNN